jgi:hypothetical protein
MNMLDPLAYAQRTRTEHAQQVALFMWAAQHAPLCPVLRLMFAIPNGGMRDKVTAANLKAEGVKTGVPDVMLPVAVNGKHGLFIEMKRPALEQANKARGKAAGRESAQQSEFAQQLSEQGYSTFVCFTFEEATQVVSGYLAGTLR